jgi:sugar phosphate isomerase/epimerase
MRSKIGVFAKHISRPTTEELFTAIAGLGFNCVPFNAACLGIPSLPDTLDKALWRQASRAAGNAEIEVVALSATFNLLDENRSRLANNFRALEVVAQGAMILGTNLLTLCSGTRDQQDMWTYHPENETPQAWQDMTDRVRQALAIAEQYDLYLGIEPEVANVVCSAQSAARLISELASDRIKIVFDPANLYRPPADPRRDRHVITDGLSLLGDSVAIAHCKDIDDPKAKPGTPQRQVLSEAYHHVAAGSGILDYRHYFSELARCLPKNVPLILHGLSEDQIPAALTFIHARLHEVDSTLNRCEEI